MTKKVITIALASVEKKSIINRGIAEDGLDENNGIYFKHCDYRIIVLVTFSCIIASEL